MISTKQTKEYQLNRNTKVVITSTKDKDADIYRTKFMLVHETADTKPMALGTRDEIKAYIGGVDLEDDNLGLDFGKV